MLQLMQQSSKYESLAKQQAKEGFAFEKGVVMSVQSPVPSVLIADADPYLCRVFEAKLHKDNQFDVVVANTGTEASLAALKQGFSLILWDARLRDTSRFLPRLRALCPRASILLMTTDDRPTLDMELRRLDITEILIKPFSLDTLIEKLRHSLSSPVLTEKTANLDFARIGQRLTLISPEGSCSTRVLERYQDSFVVVGAPRVEVPADFAPGLSVRVEINGEDARFFFQSQLFRYLSLPVPAWELALPTRIHREQRRKQPRVHLVLPIRIEPLQVDESISTESQAAILNLGATENISASGCTLISEAKLEVGMRVHFSIAASALSQIEGEGRVVRIESLHEAKNLQNSHIAITFDGLETHSDKLLRELVKAGGATQDIVRSRY